MADRTPAIPSLEDLRAKARSDVARLQSAQVAPLNPVDAEIGRARAEGAAGPARICGKAAAFALTRRTAHPYMRTSRGRAGWQSGYAEDCKSSYSGSIPLPASTCVESLRLANRDRAARSTRMKGMVDQY